MNEKGTDLFLKRKWKTVKEICPLFYSQNKSVVDLFLKSKASFR